MRFYATSAPSWWPYQTTSLGRKRAPPRVPDRGFYRILMDNGMFTWFGKNRNPPSLDTWLARLLAYARQLSARSDVGELWVIVPDWPGAPEVTWRALENRLARILCRDYHCLVPVHLRPGHSFLTAPPEIRYTLEAATRVDSQISLAVPMKLYCTRPGRGRRIPDLQCQIAFAAKTIAVAREESINVRGVHALAPSLKPSHILRLQQIGITSFDTNSWTRPNSTTLRRMAPHSAKTKEEKDRFFREVLERLVGVGVELEMPEKNGLQWLSSP